MEDWQRELQASITKPEDLARELGVDPDSIRDVMKEYRMRITPHVLKQIKEKGDAIWR